MLAISYHRLMSPPVAAQLLREARGRAELTQPELAHMLDDVPRILRLTPEQRLTELRDASRFVAAARRR